ncbi:S-adenosyl-L-methionine-dependent methyltransferase [Bombardia bombarda]|uniref:S-adenosyl-L-methionine-dependent methyltransferase n=1 Tax=Bombardia bombarda TaxID=252184 RepID=A0AA39WAB6_9PEZI|nr:S-adenosyl-L-methionine-dependent methyltransferase [Bombardia bombarda]
MSKSTKSKSASPPPPPDVSGSPPAAGSPAAIAGPTTEEALVVDTDQIDDNADADSSYGTSIASSSASLASSILKFRQENGRTYHSYKEGKYILPNDELENDRLDLQHHVWALTYDGALYTCPAGKDKPLKRVLDAGTGTGIWAVDFADDHPETTVIGVDLSPIQPAFVPPNLSFYIDDLEEPWTFSDPFDFIHVRMLTGSLADWPNFFESCFENLEPGGWVEMGDIVFPTESDDNTLPSETALYKWNQYVLKAARILGRDLDSAKLYREQLTAKGFVNISERIYKWPINAWAKDKKYKEMGLWSEQNFTEGLYGLSVGLFTRALGWSAQELEVFLVDVRKDLKNKNIHGYWPIWVVSAQKPPRV